MKREWNKYRFDDIKIGMIEQFNCCHFRKHAERPFQVGPVDKLTFSVFVSAYFLKCNKRLVKSVVQIAFTGPFHSSPQ